jgi:cytochrome c biogenesis protein CcdA
MFGIIRINLKNNNQIIEKIKLRLASKGYLGSLALGVLFALAFCPYSGVLFFGVLIPLTLNSMTGLILPGFFAAGTGLPVIVFSILIAFSMQAVGKIFNIIQIIEKWLRYGVASIFILTGIYYSQFLVKYLTSFIL